MKQVVLRGGTPQPADIPAPSPQPGRVLVANAASVISSGTERSAVDNSGSGSSLPMRALRNPQLVLQTLKFAREHGVRETTEVVRGAISDDSPLGYSSAGVVLDTGGIAEFHPGQPVACAGAGLANHAEVVSVPGNLVAAVPDGVSLRDASFTTLGAIALQGVRRLEPTLGERVVVIGLGLLGILALQLLRAAGSRVLGVEPVPARRTLATELGAERVAGPDGALAAAKDWTDGYGADAVLICASASTSAIVNQAVGMLRRKGRVVPVGDVGLDFERAPLYQREADVLISTSYGPGRYDTTYEEAGLDYPIAYVRWTENRNMEEFLRQLATGSVRVEPLVGVEVPAERAAEAYAAINGEDPPLAAVLTYPGAPAEVKPERLQLESRRVPRTTAATPVRTALVGAGGFVRSTHLPNLRSDGRVAIRAVVTRRGTTASDIARSLGGAEAATDWHVVVDDPELDLIVIGTRHDSHAQIAAAALRAGKAVFVEKPLGLSHEEIGDVWEAGGADARLAIGFNRRFAPLAQKMASEARQASGPMHLIYRVSAPLPTEHWLNDPQQGGGRIQGEACHMFDFANWLCGRPVHVTASALPTSPRATTPESVSASVSYHDGSIATVHYSGVGAADMPKERVELLRGGRSWVLDNFAELASFGPGQSGSESSRTIDKGHRELMVRLVDAVLGERPFEPDLAAGYVAQSVALATLESLAGGQPVEVRLPPDDSAAVGARADTARAS